MKIRFVRYLTEVIDLIFEDWMNTSHYGTRHFNILNEPYSQVVSIQIHILIYLSKGIKVTVLMNDVWDYVEISSNTSLQYYYKIIPSSFWSTISKNDSYVDNDDWLEIVTF